MDTPSFKEDHISQIPVLQMLVNLGYTYLSPAEADRQRGGKTTIVLLEDVLLAAPISQQNLHVLNRDLSLPNPNLSERIDFAVSLCG